MARVGMLFRSGARRGLSCPRRCGTVRSEGPGGQGSSASPCARDMRLRWTEACGKHSLSSPDAGGRSRLLVSNRRLVQHSSNPAVVTAGHLRKRAGASGWFLTTPCSPPQLRASVFPSQPRSWARSARQHGAEQRDVLVPCHPSPSEGCSSMGTPGSSAGSSALASGAAEREGSSASSSSCSAQDPTPGCIPRECLPNTCMSWSHSLSAWFISVAVICAPE
ncbi:uncharacterized protein [Patagioenas fasciata]|uniref:uncharacterized protein isoform X4 n=1 Tax=Patagioenas fasciata TaxID=372321 RepID=UPI003A9A14BC